MPKFYLHLREGDDFIEDYEGCEFPDLAAARQEAVIAAREILAERLRAGRPLDGQRIEICDETGAMIETVTFRSVFSMSPKGGER